jgi:hypothetical protein
MSRRKCCCGSGCPTCTGATGAKDFSITIAGIGAGGDPNCTTFCPTLNSTYVISPRAVDYLQMADSPPAGFQAVNATDDCQWESEFSIGGCLSGVGLSYYLMAWTQNLAAGGYRINIVLETDADSGGTLLAVYHTWFWLDFVSKPDCSAFAAASIPLQGSTDPTCDFSVATCTLSALP